MLPGGPSSAYGLAEPSRWGGAAEPLGGGIVFGESKPVFYGGGSNLHRLLKDIENRYSDAFAELGAGVLRGLKRCVDSIEAFLGLLFNGETRATVKMATYAKAKSDILSFCGYYARWLGLPLMELFKYEIYEIIEEAIHWWGKTGNL